MEDSQKDAILNAEIKRESGIRGVLHLDPEPLEIEALQFDDEHINLQRKHNITQEQAQEMIKTQRLPSPSGMAGLSDIIPIRALHMSIGKSNRYARRLGQRNLTIR